MKSIKNFTILILLSLATLESGSQWTQITTIQDKNIVALATYGDTLLAASDTNLLYKSTDSGITWSPVTVTNIPIYTYTLRVIENKIYRNKSQWRIH